jgi:hypothetical protein
MRRHGGAERLVEVNGLVEFLAHELELPGQFPIAGKRRSFDLAGRLVA